MKAQFAKGVFLYAVVASCLLQGQTDTGRIAGTITDATGAVVANVAVTVTNERTGQTRKATSNEAGIYLVTQLGPSSYGIKAEATGMAPAEYSGITLQWGRNAR